MEESVLFYSNKCKHSKDFLEKLKQHKEIDNSLMKICIDNKPLNTLPKYIKSVPTLVYNKNKLTSGAGVFEWLESKQIIQEQQKEKKNNNGFLDTSMNATQGMNLGYNGSQYYSFMSDDMNINSDTNSSYNNTFTNINEGFNNINDKTNTYESKKDSSSNIQRDLDKLIEDRRKDLERK